MEKLLWVRVTVSAAISHLAPCMFKFGLSKMHSNT
jgi:hypothetical protein